MKTLRRYGIPSLMIETYAGRAQFQRKPDRNAHRCVHGDHQARAAPDGDLRDTGPRRLLQIQTSIQRIRNVPKKPWLVLRDMPITSIIRNYPLEAVMRTVASDAIAYDFLGYTSTYRRFAEEIDKCADALAALGLKKGDSITISMPTSPQGIICFYAVNKLGGVASMIHPLSPPKEIEFYLNISKSKFALTIDAFYGNFNQVMHATGCKKLILARIPDYLGLIKRVGFNLTKGRKIPKVPADDRVIWWKDMMSGTYPKAPMANMNTHDTAVILYSGGTTGVPKGIMLSHYNFISEGMMVSCWGNLNETDKVLAILPIFHGFGLGVCVNAAFMGGGRSILVPQFTPEDVARLIKSKRPTFVIGVPTLYQALNKIRIFRKRTFRACAAVLAAPIRCPVR